MKDPPEAVPEPVEDPKRRFVVPEPTPMPPAEEYEDTEPGSTEVDDDTRPVPVVRQPEGH